MLFKVSQLLLLQLAGSPFIYWYSKQEEPVIFPLLGCRCHTWACVCLQSFSRDKCTWSVSGLLILKWMSIIKNVNPYYVKTSVSCIFMQNYLNCAKFNWFRVYLWFVFNSLPFLHSRLPFSYCPHLFICQYFKVSTLFSLAFLRRSWWQ